MVGVAAFYYLYSSYFSKSNDSTKNEEDTSELDDYPKSGREKIGSMFKNFILSIADPANNNYIDSAHKKPNPFLFRSFVDR